MDKRAYELGMRLYDEGKYEESASYLFKCIRCKDPAFMFRIGSLYYFGYGVKKDCKRAYKYYLKSAKKGYAKAQFNLGLAFIDGKGVKQNTPYGLYYIKQAMKQGFTRAHLWLAHKYKKGEYVEKNIYKALTALDEACKLGDVEAMFERGCDFIKSNQYELAFERLSQASSKNHIPSIIKLGFLYADGIGCDKNLDEALTYAQKVLDLGGHCELLLGYIYTKKKDYKKALKWFKQGDENEDRICSYNLGIFYNNGYGVKVDKKKGFECFLKSANNGYSSAQIAVAKKYHNEQKFNKAIEWYLKAAEQGDSKAYKPLSIFFLSGVIKCDNPYKKAEEYLLKSIDVLEDEESALSLARLYEDGTKLKKDIRQAAKYYQFAANKGNKVAALKTGKLFIDLGYFVPAHKYLSMIPEFDEAAELLKICEPYVLKDKLQQEESEKFFRKSQEEDEQFIKNLEAKWGNRINEYYDKMMFEYKRVGELMKKGFSYDQTGDIIMGNASERDFVKVADKKYVHKSQMQYSSQSYSSSSRDSWDWDPPSFSSSDSSSSSSDDWSSSGRTTYYDSFGNEIGHSVNGFHYDNTNMITGYDIAGVHYDNSGNRTGYNMNGYEYDNDNNLIGTWDGDTFHKI